MKKILFYILIITLLVPVFSKAQEYTLLEPLPCVEGTGNNCTVDEKGNQVMKEISLDTYINYIFKFSIALAAFLAVVMIIWGGFEYMLTDSVMTKGNAKGKIWNAVTGLILILSSYLILRTIDPRLVEIYSNIPPIKITIDNPNFQEKLEERLDSLSSKYQEDIKLLKDENEKKRAELAKLNEKEKNEGRLLDEEIVRQKTLTQEIKGNESKIIIISSEDQSTNLLLETIQNKDAIYKTYADAKDKLKVIIKEDVEGLKARNDLEGAQKLEKQGKFYIDQMDEQGALAGNVLSAERGAGSRYAEQDLVKYEREYKELLSTEPTTDKKINEIKSDPHFKSVYKTILEARINLLKNTLKK